MDQGNDKLARPSRSRPRQSSGMALKRPLAASPERLSELF